MARRTPGLVVEGYQHPVYNEHEVRAAAGITLAAGTIAFVYAYFDKLFWPIKLVSTFFFIEFIIRVFVGMQYSPTGVVSRLMMRRREPQWVSAKPKRFAWTFGLLLSGSMTVITNVNIHGTLPRTLCLICIALMWMEAVLGVCLGCELYSLLRRHQLIGKDELIEVCAGGACAIGAKPVAPRQPRRTGVQPTRPAVSRSAAFTPEPELFVSTATASSGGSAWMSR
jgi:hypothetical protein